MSAAPAHAIARASVLLGMLGGSLLLFVALLAVFLPDVVERLSRYLSVSTRHLLILATSASGLFGAVLILPALRGEGSFRQRLSDALTQAAKGTGCLGSFFLFSLLWMLLLSGPAILIWWTLYPDEWRRLIKLALFFVSTITALFYVWLRQEQFTDVKEIALFFGGWVAYPNFFADLLL